jgi:hypothetical protein
VHCSRQSTAINSNPRPSTAVNVNQQPSAHSPSGARSASAKQREREELEGREHVEQR